MTRYWSTHRPVSIGTYPSDCKVTNVVNFDGMQAVPELGGRMAFGYIDIDGTLPRSEQDHYDLRPEGANDARVEHLARILARAMLNGNDKTADKVLDKAAEEGIDEGRLYEATCRVMMEADA